MASVWFGSPLSRTTRTASATYSATPSPTPSGVIENAISIRCSFFPSYGAHCGADLAAG
jgi:hypothetical protein